MLKNQQINLNFPPDLVARSIQRYLSNRWDKTKLSFFGFREAFFWLQNFGFCFEGTKNWKFFVWKKGNSMALARIEQLTIHSSQNYRIVASQSIARANYSSRPSRSFKYGSSENWTRDLCLMRAALYHWATEPWNWLSSIIFKLAISRRWKSLKIHHISSLLKLGIY